MRKTEKFTGRLCKKRITPLGTRTLIFNDFRHFVKVECGKQLYEQLCEGLDLTITYTGKQLVSWRAASGKPEALSTAIAETAAYHHGKALYYRSSRCMNAPELQECNQGLFTGEEIVSFDCCLFEHLPVRYEEIEFPCPGHQYLGVIVEPAAQPSAEIGQDSRFAFCGYDLVEEMTQISAITNCKAAYSGAINYAALNSFGLISSYADAKHTQQLLHQVYPNEVYANCVIVEIWRYSADS